MIPHCRRRRPTPLMTAHHAPRAAMSGLRGVAAGVLIAALGVSAQVAHAQGATNDGRPAPAGGAQAGKVDLRPKFRAGQEARFDMDLRIAGSQAFADLGESKTESTQKLGLKMVVRDAAPGGSATVDMIYESVSLRSVNPMMTIEFDSAAKPKPEDPIDAMLRPIVGVTLRLVVDATGNIQSVTPVGDSPSSSAAAGGMGGQLLSQFTGADIVRGMFGRIFTISAGDGTYSVGETWTNESAMGGAMGGWKVRNTYTLESHRGTKANIRISGTVQLDGSASGPASIKEGSTSGTATWNTEDGLLDTMDYTQKLVVETRTGAETVRSTQDMTVQVRRK